MGGLLDRCDSPPPLPSPTSPQAGGGHVERGEGPRARGEGALARERRIPASMGCAGNSPAESQHRCRQNAWKIRVFAGSIDKRGRNFTIRTKKEHVKVCQDGSSEKRYRGQYHAMSPRAKLIKAVRRNPSDVRFETPVRSRNGWASCTKAARAVTAPTNGQASRSASTFRTEGKKSPGIKPSN